MIDRLPRIMLFGNLVFTCVSMIFAGTDLSRHFYFHIGIATVQIAVLVWQTWFVLQHERWRYEAALKFSRRAFGVSDDGAAMVGTSPITSIKPGGIGGYTLVPVTMLGGPLGGGGGGQTKGQASATAIIQGGSLVSGPTLRR